MLRFVCLWFLAGVATIPVTALAQDAAPKSVAADAADAGIPDVPDAVVTAKAAPSASPAIANPDAPVKPGDVLDASRAAVDAVQGAISRPTLLSIVFAISAALWAILAAIRAFGARWLSGRAIRLITLVAAPVLTFASAFGAGMHWFDAIMLAGGGPGALLLNELRRGIKPPAG